MTLHVTATTARSLALFLVLLAGTACGGRARERSLDGGDSHASGTAEGDAAGSSVATGSPDGGAADGSLADGPGLDGGDPGRVSIHLLNAVEYANTVQDLLGVPAPLPMSAPTVANGPSVGFDHDFDNNADDLSVTADSYAWYFETARVIASEAFADPALQARILTCAPSAAVDPACAESIIRTFGIRAWRRPLTDAEVTDLVQLASDTSTDGPPVVISAPNAAAAQFAGAMEEVVVAMLASESFLYRIEYDSDPNSAVVHPLSPYELASRLSYLLWSTMPDDELFTHAAAGDLGNDDVLSAELTRMLSDSRSDQFVHNFAGQWLNFRGIGTLDVDTTVFPNWSSALGSAMEREAFLYVSQFRDPTRKLTDLLTADVNFVDAPLAQLYGFAGVDAGEGFVEVDGATTLRRGYLGLAAFLTITSWPNQTSPPSRGQWIMDQWLCQAMPNDTSNVPPADMTPPRQRLESLETTPACAACHKAIDFLGFGLENFDAIGEYRAEYPGGGAIDASGVIPGGIAYSGETDLAGKLAQDPRAADCIARKALAYALGRTLVATDDSYVVQLRDAWIAAGSSLPALLAGIAKNDTFRLRRGEGP
jgi:hypothetical protein